jgi:hypothetical protein
VRMWWWILGGLAALFVATLALGEVFGWFEENTAVDSEYGALIKERLANGNYRVVAGIFDKRDVQTAVNEWETEELDEDLEEYFGPYDHIKVEF